ncbi:MAG: transcriptional regulator [Verrucomicrobiales bacterium VVV1]|nr:MAG: transcriptional regulator [Verrucomicrobiales bacterium VVV1]
MRTNSSLPLHANECNVRLRQMRIKTVTALGELVRDQRKQHGWSQSELAEKAEVSRLWIGQFEKGKETVEVGKVLQTLRALGLSLEVDQPRSGVLIGGLLRA